jgi:hypothetical protein
LLVDLIPANQVVFGEAPDARNVVVSRPRANCADTGKLEQRFGGLPLQGRCRFNGYEVAAEFVDRTLGTSSMRALGIRSSYKGRTVDAQAMRGDEGRGQLRKASASR